jgi:N-acetylglucosaminyldiphosphoundecaprenol N-acetyl-beta-D-mannosaminyltransferase
MPTPYQTSAPRTLGEELLAGSPSPRIAKRGRRARRFFADATRRVVEFGFAASMLLAFAPILLPAIAFRSLFGWPFDKRLCLGERRRPFSIVHLKLGDGRVDRWLARWGVDRLPALVQLLRGNLALVGPRAASPQDAAMTGGSAGGRFRVKPGFVCLWWIRQRTNIAYGSELAADRQYVASRTLLGDAGILARAALAGLYGKTKRAAGDSIRLFDLPIANLTMTAAVDRMVNQLSADEPRQVCFINADCVNLSFRNADYRRVLQASWMNLADGIGMKLAGRAFRQEIRENQCGTDVFLRLCEALAGTEHSIYLLGGKPGVADRVCVWMAEHYPTTRIAGARHGFFTAAEEPQVLHDIAASGASVLLVALGAPRQDLWTAAHLQAAGVPLAMGVGGLFDYYSGNVPRAPLWVREIGMEWAFRLLQEPKRLARRYLCGNTVFLARLAWRRLRRRLS